MGDVAMTIPVIKQLLEQHPDLDISFVSNKSFKPMFFGIDRLRFIAAETKGKHKGILGIYRLCKEIIRNGKPIDGVADFHGVLRSFMMQFFLKLKGIPIATIDKGRAEKKKLTAKENKQNKQNIPLKTSFERYADVIKKLGLSFLLEKKPLENIKQPLPILAEKWFENKTVIGIAPFAKHPEKVYPPEKMKLFIQLLQQEDAVVLLFGGGKQETAFLAEWEKQLGRNVYNLAGLFNLSEELSVISNLTAMVSMDSANMHLASLVGVPVVSVWGPTHPNAGFYGWGQSIENMVSIDLSCRPCSVFGNKPCYRGDHACMEEINHLDIYQKLIPFLKNNHL
jgi:ADP-heptose:LPS heptosyltransferase